MTRPRVINSNRFAANRERIKRELNPCPGRTTTEREYISRRLVEIADILDYHLDKLQSEGQQPMWLPEACITPTQDLDNAESLEAFQGAHRDSDKCIMSMHNPNQRASNRVRIATWYKTASGDLYMTQMIALSPLLCAEWGALPLTLAQWRLIIPQITATHMYWKWVHAVRQYLHDDSYQVGGTFGWYMEKCKKLPKDHSALCTGQAIYSHVVRQYSEHVSAISGIACQS